MRVKRVGLTDTQCRRIDRRNARPRKKHAAAAASRRAHEATAVAAAAVVVAAVLLLLLLAWAGYGQLPMFLGPLGPAS